VDYGAHGKDKCILMQAGNELQKGEEGNVPSNIWARRNTISIFPTAFVINTNISKKNGHHIMGSPTGTATQCTDSLCKLNYHII